MFMWGTAKALNQKILAFHEKLAPETKNACVHAYVIHKRQFVEQYAVRYVWQLLRPQLEIERHMFPALAAFVYMQNASGLYMYCTYISCSFAVDIFSGGDKTSSFFVIRDTFVTELSYLSLACLACQAGRQFNERVKTGSLCVMSRWKRKHD